MLSATSLGEATVALDVHGAHQAAEPSPKSPGRSWWGGPGLPLPCPRSWHLGTVGSPVGCRDAGARNGNGASGAGRLVCCPSFPAPTARISPIPALARLLAFPGGSCCPTQQQCVRRTRRRTSLLLYTNRAGIGTQCCPRQEGRRQTEREGDIREVLRTDCDSTEENRLQRQQLGLRTAQCPTAALASKARHPAALPVASPPRGRGVPAAPRAGSVSQKPAQMVPLPRPKAGAWFGGRHGRPLPHKLCHGVAAARRGERRGRTETKG